MELTRDNFMEKTGIYVSPEYYKLVELEWLRAMDMGITLDDFLRNYEQDHIWEVIEIPPKTLKYLIMDDYISCIGELEYDPTIQDILDSHARDRAEERAEKIKIMEECKTIINHVISQLLVFSDPETDLLS